VLVCNETQNIREIRESQPRIIALRQNEGWLDALVLIVSEALRRSDAEKRLAQAEHEITVLQQQATLGSYMREMLHTLNNALTSVLGNAELLLLEPGSLTANSRSQIETIRNMALRMHEILHRFASLEKELKVVATQTAKDSSTKTQSAGAR
jgi:signal transduction histidine kinase